MLTHKESWEISWIRPTEVAGVCSQSQGRVHRDTGNPPHCRIVKDDEMASRRAVVLWRDSSGVLEPYMGKLVRPVLRGEGRSNPPALPGLALDKHIIYHKNFIITVDVTTGICMIAYYDVCNT